MSDIFDILLRANHNGKIAPPESDTWTEHFDSATPAGQRAMALGAHRRAEKLAAAVEPNPEPAPDPKSTFHQKNAVLLDRIIGRPATDTNTKD